MSIKHAILGLLAEGPMHGYDLATTFDQEVAAPASGGKKLNPGQVYSTLERLARDGLVALLEKVSQEGRPEKAVYTLTEAGRAELYTWLRHPTEHELDLRNETFLKLILARRVKEADPLEVLAIERRACFQRLHEVSQVRDLAAKKGAQIATLMLLELALLRLDAFLKWLDRCEELLSQGEPS